MEEKKIVVYACMGSGRTNLQMGVQWWMCRLTWRRS